jgi:hypothetical protein
MDEKIVVSNSTPLNFSNIGQFEILLRMYKRRLKGYKAIGYSIQENTF